MKLINNGFVYLTVLLVILSVFTEEAEARRKVLRGRKTVTRRYYRGLAIPAWAIIVLVGLGNLLIGGILYVALRKFILTDSEETANTYAGTTYAGANYQAASINDV